MVLNFGGFREGGVDVFCEIAIALSQKRKLRKKKVSEICTVFRAGGRGVISSALKRRI
jgi:hypothetical protein